MNLLDLVQRHVPLRRVSNNKGGEWHGPCPACGTSQRDPAKSDRFVVWPESGGWMCRNCGSGDDIEFLRRFESLSCPDAHEALGRDCASTSCAVLDKCRLGRGKSGTGAPALLADPPKPRKPAEWTPQQANSPCEQWRSKAAALVEWTHAQLLACPEQLDYLAGRGLPLGAVKKYRLGWIPQALYRPRDGWGLPFEISATTGKEKVLWLPQGIVIPYFDPHGVHRLRIRQPQGEPRYYWVPGSGDDVLIIGEEIRAHVVVESDLDALLVEWLAGDLVAAVPLGTCNAKPKHRAAAALAKSLCILVALDFEPRLNEQTGKQENPGGQAAAWWLKTYEQAQRWPAPCGKDPGDYYQACGYVRRWIIEGLPPGLRHAPQACAKGGPSETTPAPPASAEIFRGTTPSGLVYFVVVDPAMVAGMIEKHPGHAVFTWAEVQKLKGLSQEAAEEFIKIKQAFPGADIRHVKPLAAS